MEFYRAIHKTKDCNVVLGIFMTKRDADEYCEWQSKIYDGLNFYIDTIETNQEISAAFLRHKG